jgi:hypothetical protein
MGSGSSDKEGIKKETAPVFRPVSGQQYALYVDGVRCSFESLSMTYGINQVPSLVARIPATHGTFDKKGLSPQQAQEVEELEARKAVLERQLPTPGAELSEALKGSAYQIQQAIYANEASLEQATKLSHAIIGQSNFSVGRAQFDIGQKPNIFRSLGYSQEEINQISRLGVKVRNAGSLSALSSEEQAFINTMEQKLPGQAGRIAKLDAGQIQNVINAIDAAIGRYLPGYSATALARAQLADMANQFGEAFLTVPHPTTGEALYLITKLGELSASDKKIDSNDVLQLRYLTLFSQRSPANKTNQTNRHSRVERVFRQIAGLPGATQIISAAQAKSKAAIAKLEEQVRELEDKISDIRSNAETLLEADISWRNIRPNTKIHVLYKDVNWGEKPRFACVFEGEIISPGFQRGPESRNFQFTAMHIADALETQEIAVLDPAGYIEEELSGNLEAQGIQKEKSLFTAVENFSPERIAQTYGINPNRLDIYNYAIYGLQTFINNLAESPVRNAYHTLALRTHDIVHRIYDPQFEKGKNPAASERKSTIDWKEFYHLIMHYTFQNLLPRMGGRISFMQILRSVAQYSLHEVFVLPCPTNERNTIITKPFNVFSPIPTCNVVFPIMGPEYNFSELWKAKPTRLIQVANPPNGLTVDSVLRRYYRNIAPGSLNEAFQRYQTIPKDAPERKEFELITEEEKQRGIIASYNDVPSFVTAALDVISQDAQSKATDGEVTGAGKGFEKVQPIIIPDIFEGSKGNTDPDVLKKFEELHKLMYYNQELLKLEGKEEPIPRDILVNGHVPFTSEYRFIPNRITIIQAADKREGKEGLATYNIQNGKVTLQIGRLFRIFEEPGQIIPMALAINAPVADVRPNIPRPFRSFQYYGNNSPKVAQVADLLSTEYKINSNSDILAHVKKMEKHVGGGVHQSIIIQVDEASASFSALRRLLALLMKFIELPYKNIRTFSEYFPDTKQATREGDAKIRENILKSSIDRVQKEVDAGFKGYLKKNDPQFSEQRKRLEKKEIPEKEEVRANSPAPVKSETKIDVQKAVKEKKVEAQLVGGKVPITTVYDKYTQPLCEYYFYYNRYINNQTNMLIAHNPYIVPGYSTIILDSSEMGMHLLAYVGQITQNIIAEGQLSTMINTQFVRRGDDLGMRQELKETASRLEDGSLPETVAESLNGRIPFFGGEYTDEKISETYKKTIGCDRLVEGQITEENLHTTDYKTALSWIKRAMQYCKITDFPLISESDQILYNELYENNPSRIMFKYPGSFAFPDEIHVLYDPQNNLDTIVNANTQEELESADLFDDGRLFNAENRRLVWHHTNITKFKRAQRG